LQALSGGGGDHAQARAELLLELLVDRAGLVQERSPDVFAFVHLSFQEYLAARSFVGRGDVGLGDLANLATDERQGEVCRLAVAILSADQRTEADERAAGFITSIGAHSPALAAACLLEAPGVRLEVGFAERMARSVSSECSDPRRHYYPPHVTARLVWAALKHASAADRVLLQVLSDSDSGFEEERFFSRHRRHRHFEDRHFREFWRHEMRMMPALAIVATRPPGALTAELAWVLQQLTTTSREQGGRVFRSLAALILIEEGKAQDRDHVPALVDLLADDERERGNSSIVKSIVSRAERLLEKLWKALDTRTTIRDVLTQRLSSETEHSDPYPYPSELAWAAAKFLIEHGDLTDPRLTKIVITVGLERRSRHPVALSLLRTLAGDPTLGPVTTGMLRDGLLSTDADIRAGSFRALLDLGLISGAEPMADDEQGLSMKLLADPDTAKEALATLAENLWAESHATAWHAAKSLIDASHADIPGVPHALVHSGLVSARAEAMQYLRRLHGDPALSISIRGALLGGLTSTNGPVATSTALVLAEGDARDNTPLLGRIVQALLRSPEQVDEVLPHLKQLVRDKQRNGKVLEVLGSRLGDKPDRRVASAVARMLAEQGLLYVRNLPEALVRFGLHYMADHREVAEYLRRMLDDPELATIARRALFEGLASGEGDVAVGSASILWEAGSKTHPKIAEVLAGAGLRIGGQREQARAWLLELFAHPKTAAIARRALEDAASSAVGAQREPDHAWAIANCLLEARVYHADHLAKTLVIGGLHRREDHSKTLPKIRQTVAESAELAVSIEEALWEGLADKDADVQWGAASALIGNGFVEAILARGSHVDDDESDYRHDRAENERVEMLSRLWRVLIREATREPLASEALSSLSHGASASAPEHRALRKLLDAEDSPEAACAAAYRLLTEPKDSLPAVAITLVKHGLTDRDRKSEASRRLEELLEDALTRPVIVDALQRALWSEHRDVAWASAKFQLERGYAPSLGIFRALVWGGLSSSERREAEGRLRELLGDPSLQGAVMDALNVGMYDEAEENSAAMRLLVEASAPLNNRILMALNDLFLWQPWVPLALMALTGGQREVAEGAARLELTPLREIATACS
jgi:hypothetical protein